MDQEEKEHEKRFSDIEVAITELTMLNKNQEATAIKQATSIDKILEHLQNMAVLEHVVENNIKDITKMDDKINDIYSKISIKESQMQKQIDKNRTELSVLGGNRLIRGVLIATAISTFLFGYLYLDLHRAERNITRVIQDFSKDVKDNAKSVYKMEQSVTHIEKDHDTNKAKFESKFDTLLGPRQP